MVSVRADHPLERVVERLREKKPIPGSLEAILVEAVKAQERVETSPVSQRRVFERVLARALEQRSVRRLRRRLLVRSLVVGGLLSVAGATVASMLSRRWTTKGAATFDDHAVVQPDARRLTKDPSQQLRAETIPKLDSTEPSPSSSPHPPTVPTVRSGTNATVRIRKEKVDDPSWVVDAIRALRQEHDPIAARKLLSAYLKVYPDGALSEEALALSIEATEESGDPEALMLAIRYLKEFPDGRFRGVAELVVKRHPL